MQRRIEELGKEAAATAAAFNEAAQAAKKAREVEAAWKAKMDRVKMAWINAAKKAREAEADSTMKAIKATNAARKVQEARAAPEVRAARAPKAAEHRAHARPK